MWFKRKTKEEKEQELQKELTDLRNKYADEIDSYCKINNYIFILKGFEIKNNQIILKFKDKDSIEGYINYIELYFFDIKYGTINFKEARFQFIKFKDDLSKIGLKLEKTL